MQGGEAEDVSVLGEPGRKERLSKQPLSTCPRVERCTHIHLAFLVNFKRSCSRLGTTHHPVSSWREWPGGFGVRKLEGERPNREAQHWLEAQSPGPWQMSEPWLPSRGAVASSLPPPLPVGVCLRVEGIPGSH